MLCFFHLAKQNMLNTHRNLPRVQPQRLSEMTNDMPSLGNDQRHAGIANSQCLEIDIRLRRIVLSLLAREQHSVFHQTQQNMPYTQRTLPVRDVYKNTMQRPWEVIKV